LLLIDSRRADLKSLRESLNRIRRDPKKFFEYQDPKEFLNPPDWNQAQPSNKHSETLDEILNNIETTHPALSIKRFVHFRVILMIKTLLEG
jgi:hypothetical protein